MAFAVGACATLSLLLGLFPGPLARASRAAAVAAVTHPIVREGEVALGQSPVRRRPGPWRPRRTIDLDHRLASRFPARWPRAISPNRAVGLAASFQAHVGVQPHSSRRRLVPGVPSGLCHDGSRGGPAGRPAISLEARRAPLVAGLLEAVSGDRGASRPGAAPGRGGSDRPSRVERARGRPAGRLPGDSTPPTRPPR